MFENTSGNHPRRPEFPPPAVAPFWSEPEPAFRRNDLAANLRQVAMQRGLANILPVGDGDFEFLGITPHQLEDYIIVHSGRKLLSGAKVSLA